VAKSEAVDINMAKTWLIIKTDGDVVSINTQLPVIAKRLKLIKTTIVTQKTTFVNAAFCNRLRLLRQLWDKCFLEQSKRKTCQHVHAIYNQTQDSLDAQSKHND